MQESAPRFRFDLASLLILPLWASPLFLSTVFVREQFERHGPSMALFFNMLACTAAYAAFFTARSRCRLYREGRSGARHVLPAAWRGALFGLLFMVQIIVPWWAAILLADAQRNGVSLSAFLSILPDRILELAAMAGLFGLFGFFLGAFGGSLVGIVFDRRCAHGQARHASSSLSLQRQAE